MITEKIFESEILPYLKNVKRSYDSQYSLYNYFQTIVYRLKTGCQWRQLPLKQFFNGEIPVWQSVYYHYWKWCQTSCFKTLWLRYCQKVKQYFDLEMINIDGSHTPAKRGGQAVAYQNRKKAKTTNMLFITDNLGNFLACTEPIAGNHHDSYNLIDNFEKMRRYPILRNARWQVINGDSAFDVKDFFNHCLENSFLPNFKPNQRNSKKEINIYTKMIFPDDYKERFVIERSFAWLDSFKLLLVRYEVKANHWYQNHFLAFFMILLRKYYNV
jgi:transposase